MSDRELAQEEADGMEWWNQCSRYERAAWCREAGNARPADAWAAYKRVRDRASMSDAPLGYDLPHEDYYEPYSTSAGPHEPD
jgi:hypothetical protein